MSFDEAAVSVLAYLREHVPLGFWSVTRVENGRQTYLYLDADNTYGLSQGGSHPWDDSVCRRMIAGDGPQIAPVVADVAPYRDAPIVSRVEIGAYAGAPIIEPDGSLFGVICGLDRVPQPGALRANTDLLSLLSSLLGVVLAADRARTEAERVASHALLLAETDAMTGLYNRRAWERLIDEEEVRFERFADPTIVVLLDLDRLKAINDASGHSAGDAYIVKAATALRTAVEANQPVARLGGDEFGVIVAGCTEADGAAYADSLASALADAGVAGCFGWAPLRVVAGFPAALKAADEAMYAAKRNRRSA